MEAATVWLIFIPRCVLSCCREEQRKYQLLLKISSLQDGLRTFNDNVARIGDLHSRSLNNTDDAAAQRNAQQLDDLVNETSALSETLKRRVKALERQGGSGRDGQIRKQQVRSVLEFLMFRLTPGLCLTDRSCQVEIRRSYSALSNGGATIPDKIQAENGKTI